LIEGDGLPSLLSISLFRSRVPYPSVLSELRMEEFMDYLETDIARHLLPDFSEDFLLLSTTVGSSKCCSWMARVW